MIRETQYQDFSWQLHADAGHKPVVGQFELTYACGLKCAHCYTDCYNTPEDRRREMSTGEAIAVIDKIVEGGCFWLCLTGGDPLAHHDFKTVYSYAKSRGLILTIFTTGTSMTPEMADFLAAAPPFNIETTIHGVTAEVYEAVTQRPGSFDRFMRGIRLILDRSLPLKLKTVAMRQNLHELSAIRAFVEELGMQPQISTTLHARLNGDVTPGDYRLSVEEIANLNRPLDGDSSAEDRGCKSCSSGDELEAFLRPVDPTNKLFRCGIGYDSFWVNPYGRMCLCVAVREPSYDLLRGTLQEGFEQLSRGIRELTFQGDSECTTCTLWDRCAKCPGKALLETGSLEGDIDHFCQVTHRMADAGNVPRPAGTSSWQEVYEAKRARRIARAQRANMSDNSSFQPLPVVEPSLVLSADSSCSSTGT